MFFEYLNALNTLNTLNVLNNLNIFSSLYPFASTVNEGKIESRWKPGMVFRCLVSGRNWCQS